MYSWKAVIVLVLPFISGGHCQARERVLPNLPYGPDAEQLLDLHLPSDDTIRWTKVIVVLHGGAWGMGKKEDVNPDVASLRARLPDYVIANMDYRLGTRESPGFPKQLDDIQLALTFLKASFPSTTLSFTFFGVSAGAHLAMLYSYAWDRGIGDAKVVVSYVGPVDFTDPAYCGVILYRPIIEPLLGSENNCQEYPDTWNVTSPLTYASTESPPTIGFYGNLDILVPNSQMVRFEEKMFELGVPHEFTRYPGGHGDWGEINMNDMWTKIAAFAELYS